VETSPIPQQVLRHKAGSSRRFHLRLRAVQSAGYDDAQIIVIVLHAALNTWTNYINGVTMTDIDFPVVTARAAA
jgi:alkylhydroperoxidase family enzyme